MTEREVRGVLIATGLHIGGVPTARIAMTDDLEMEPETVVITSDVAELLEHVEAWWSVHWLRHRGGAGP